MCVFVLSVLVRECVSVVSVSVFVCECERFSVKMRECVIVLVFCVCEYVSGWVS